MLAFVGEADRDGAVLLVLVVSGVDSSDIRSLGLTLPRAYSHRCSVEKISVRYERTHHSEMARQSFKEVFMNTGVLMHGSRRARGPAQIAL